MKKNILLFAFLLSSSLPLFSQDVDIMMQAWYWDYFQNGNYGNWITSLNNKATELDNAGFKHIWLPPLSRSSNSDNFSNGYNPKNLFDLGEYGPGCAWGNRTQLNTLISNYNSKGLNVISDMIYNHRDGGLLEKNQAVRYFITNASNSAIYPSDRVVLVLPLGSANAGNNGAGDYYIKVRSKSYGYDGSGYKFYAKTNATNTYLGSINELEPNGGGDCTEASQITPLATDVLCTLGPDINGCHTDEFKITLNSGNFNATDDTLFIYMSNTGGYSDHYIYGLWSAPRMLNIVGEVQYFTYTKYYNTANGMGAMDYNAFRPNDNTANAGGVTETLGCDWNCPLFFYDYDQSQTACTSVLNTWSKWELQQGIKGFRMDAVKNFDPAYVGQLMTYLYNEGTIPQFVVGEYFDYSPSALNGWITSVYSNMSGPAASSIKVRAFDFALRNTLRNVCDFGDDARNIYQAGMVDKISGTGSGFNAVTFVDNHDLRKDGLGINNEAMLAYAYIMTNNQIGAPCVFYPDYYGGQVGATPNIMLKSRIDDLILLHQTYIYGSPNVEYLSRYSTPYAQYFVPNGNNGGPERTVIYQLQPNGSGNNVIVAINFSTNPLDMYQKIRTNWGAPAGTTFTDMLGYSSSTTTNITNNEEIHVVLPPRSYTVYVQGVQTPLPVELVDFQVSAREKTVLLTWKTATEKDFDHYDIERATGTSINFVSIGAVAAKNGTGPANYSFTDENPAINTDLNYRLRMVDEDGTAQYSPVHTVRIERHDISAVLTPNPATEQSTLFLHLEQEQNLQIEVTDYLGRRCWTHAFLQVSGDNALDLPLSDWPAGVYQVLVRGESEQQVLRLVRN